MLNSEDTYYRNKYLKYKKKYMDQKAGMLSEPTAKSPKIVLTLMSTNAPTYNEHIKLQKLPKEDMTPYHQKYPANSRGKIRAPDKPLTLQCIIEGDPKIYKLPGQNEEYFRELAMGQYNIFNASTDILPHIAQIKNKDMAIEVFSGPMWRLKEEEPIERIIISAQGMPRTSKIIGILISEAQSDKKNEILILDDYDYEENKLMMPLPNPKPMPVDGNNGIIGWVNKKGLRQLLELAFGEGKITDELLEKYVKIFVDFINDFVIQPIIKDQILLDNIKKLNPRDYTIGDEKGKYYASFLTDFLNGILLLTTLNLLIYTDNSLDEYLEKFMITPRIKTVEKRDIGKDKLTVNNKDALAQFDLVEKQVGMGAKTEHCFYRIKTSKLTITAFLDFIENMNNPDMEKKIGISIKMFHDSCQDDFDDPPLIELFKKYQGDGTLFEATQTTQKLA